MKFQVVEEKPLYRCEVRQNRKTEAIELYADDLRKAPVGTQWRKLEHGYDPVYGNCVTVTIVYTDRYGVLLQENRKGKISVAWIFLHERS